MIQPAPGALIHQPVEHQHPDREHHGGEGEQQDQQVFKPLHGVSSAAAHALIPFHGAGPPPAG